MEDKYNSRKSRNMKNKILSEIKESIKVKQEIISQIPLIIDLSNEIVKTIKNNGKIIFCGNGGSAADSQHIVAEFVGKFNLERKSLPAIALTTNTSTITAIANDFSFEKVFSRQIEALCNKNDLVIGISTSGNSKNVINAIKSAKKIKANTIGLTGKNGGVLSKIAKKTIKVSSNNTQRIQETHLLIEHLICSTVEELMFKNSN